jgi:hypothetical protein
MCKNLLVLAVFSIAGVLSMPAHGNTIDTFDFTESNWSQFALPSGTLIPVSSDTLTGSFTGVVETNGFIELGDLTQFNAQFDSAGVVDGFLPLTGLSLFSYDTAPAGGPSSLDFAGIPGGGMNACVGAATSLDPACAFLNATYPPGTVGTTLLFGGAFDLVSSSAPQITLVSSVTTSVAPEPSSIFIECIVLVVIAILARRRLVS